MTGAVRPPAAGDGGVAEPLTAIDLRRPGPGSAMMVASGQALVFAEDRDGARVPVCAMSAGGLIVGCSGPMLVTGLPGTTIREVALAGLDLEVAQTWIAALGAAVAAGHWPAQVVPLAVAGQMLAPGEHITGPPDHPVTWASVRRGAAELCGYSTASVGPLDAPVPLARGAWLTAGLRARITEVPAPGDAQELAESLDLLGRLALAAVLERRAAANSQAAARLEGRSNRASSAAQEAVDTLAAAVGGRERPPTLSDAGLSAQLGAAAQVARAVGLTVSDEALEAAAGEVESGRDPATAVAGACGGRARQVRLASGWWRREGVPALVQVCPEGSQAKHPAALVYRGGWLLLDPRAERPVAVTAGLAGTIQPAAVEFLPVLPGRPAGLSDLARMALRGSGREIWVVLAVTVMLAGLSFLTPFLMGQVTALFTANNPASAWAGLYGALILVVLAGTAWQAVRALALLRARAKAAAVASGALWERVMRQRSTWHAQFGIGNRAGQAGAVNNASAALPDDTVIRLLDLATVVGSLAAVATAGLELLLWLSVLLVGQLLVTVWLLRSAATRAAQRVEAAATATSRLMETLAAVNRLRIAGAQSRAFLRWAQVQARFSRADLALRRTTMVQGIVIAIWPVFALVVVVWVTAATDATFGVFVTAQTAAAAATGAVAAMSVAASGALIARQTLRQAEPALAAVPEGGVSGVQPGVLSGSLDVRDLVFRYQPDGPAVLDGINLSIAAGEQVAIVGPSGCGKTTLMRVLLGLDDPQSGVIAVDGRDMAVLDRAAVRRQVGSVLQSSKLLPGTIKDNIDMGRSMTQDQIWEALEAAAMAADVRTLAMGIDTPVTDGGGTLSGGQRQRILMARALAGSPRMLVLDEATSALDNLTQAAVVAGLARLRITRIVVAHRLSTIRTADRVVVLFGGRVAAVGTYDELLMSSEVFADLARRQQA